MDCDNALEGAFPGDCILSNRAADWAAAKAAG
jgi:predicted oxidoreductase